MLEKIKLMLARASIWLLMIDTILLYPTIIFILVINKLLNNTYVVTVFMIHIFLFFVPYSVFIILDLKKMTIIIKETPIPTTILSSSLFRLFDMFFSYYYVTKFEKILNMFSLIMTYRTSLLIFNFCFIFVINLFCAFIKYIIFIKRSKYQIVTTYENINVEIIKINDIQCSICLDHYTDHDPIRTLECKHMFHNLCINKWINNHTITCPICRQESVNIIVEK